MKPMIYTGSYFWEGNVASAAYADHPLWIAHWGTTCPKLPNQWSAEGWLFHQFSATGSVAGISGDVDENRFNGSLAELQALKGDPECLADPSYTGCSGASIASCQGASLVTTSCGAGNSCSTSGGLPHCVAGACTANLDGETGTFCLDDTRIGTCTSGTYSEDACPAGGKCAMSLFDAYCVDFNCHSNLDGAGDGTFCVDQTRLATCALGQYSVSDCASDGGTCSDAGGSGHCVDARCEKGEDGTFCLDEDTLATCPLGVYATESCGTHGVCVTTAFGGLCIGDEPPADEDPTPDTSQGQDTSWPDGTLPWPDTGAPSDTSAPLEDTGPLPDDSVGSGATAGRPTRSSATQLSNAPADGCAGGGATPLPWAAALALLALVRRRRRARPLAPGGSR